MNQSRWLRTFLIATAILALVGTGWMVAKARRARVMASQTLARIQHRPIPVRTSLVSESSVDAVVGATALTTPSAELSIRLGNSRGFNDVNLVITKVHVTDGDYVEAQQLLFEIDATALQFAVEEKRNDLAAANAGRAQAEAALVENQKTRKVELDAAAAELLFREADVAFRQKDYERLKELRADRNASLLEYLEASAFYSKAQFEYTRALLRDQVAKSDMIVGPLKDGQNVEKTRAGVQKATLALAVANRNLEFTKLRAPFAGFIDELDVTPGQLVEKSHTFAELLKVDPIHVRVDYPQERIDALAVGKAARVVLDSFAQETFTGLVVKIGSRVDPKLRVLPVIVEIDNDDHRIKPGISGFARIGGSRTTLNLPSTAVIQQGGSAMVFRVENGRARIRRIRTAGVVEFGITEVLSGLTAGDEVVVFGQESLQDNDPVDVDWRRWARRD